MSEPEIMPKKNGTDVPMTITKKITDETETERPGRPRLRVTMPKPRRTKSSGSKPEELFALQIRAAGLRAPEREYRLVPTRRFRWDFAWPIYGIVAEIQGAIWITGAHSTGAGITRDCEKANLACLAGFRTLFFTPAMVKDGTALATLEKVLTS